MKPVPATQPDVLAPHPSLSTGVIEINVLTSADVEPALEDAIHSVTPAAVHHGMGILITRIGLGRYVVRAHPDVPEGLVRRR